MHVEHVAEHAVADRHRDAVTECCARSCRGCRPSVGFRQMTRTRLSPICCATSAVIVIVSPSSSMSISSALLISGSASGGNSTSTTGPAIATTRPSFSVGRSGCRRSAVMVIDRSSCSASCGACEEVGVAASMVSATTSSDAALPRSASAPPTISMISVVIGVLAGAVHHPGEAGDQVVGVVGRGLHRPLARRVLRRGRVRAARRRCGPRRSAAAGASRIASGRGLELVRGAAGRRRRRPASGRPSPPASVSRSSGISGCATTSWRADRDEPGVDDLHEVDLAGEERLA